MADASSIAQNVLGGLLVIFLVGLAPGIFIGLWWMFKEPKFRGPALTGTAQVVSLRQIGSMGLNEPVRRYMCLINLRMEVPGRESYEAKVRQRFLPWKMDAVRPGSTVPVQVDSTNPQRVHIAFSQPSGPSAQQVTFFNTNMPTPGNPANPMEVRINLSASGGSVHSAAELLASGQRVSGVLKSFAATGTTARSESLTPSRPDLFDAPRYKLVIELHFPNLAPLESRSTQPVPPAHLPNLAIGLQLPCAVDPANPQICVVDWDAVTG